MPQSLRSINEAIRPSVAEFIGSLADNLTQVIKDRLSGFSKRFSEEIAKVQKSPNSTARLSRSWEQVVVGFCAYKGFINGQ